MSADHTPGEWGLLRFGVEVKSDDYCHEIHAGEHSACVARIPIECHATTHGEFGETVISAAEALANARLFLAAPYLLAALVELLAVAPAKAPAARQIVGIEQRHAAAVAAAKAAISMARQKKRLQA